MNERELQGRVARLHYQHGLTHQEVGDLLGLSRIKVTRLLAAARDNGVVEIRVHTTSRPFHELETALVRRFGLQQAWVAPSCRDGERERNAVGSTGAQALEAVVPRSGTVAVGLSSSVATVVPHIHVPPRPELGFVPLAGSWGGVSRGMNPHELALRFGTAFGARTYHLPAPILAATAEAAAAFRADPSVRDAERRAAGADVLVAGVGGIEQSSGMMIDALSEDDRRRLDTGAAVGDISARYFDRDGRPVRGGLDDRVVGMDLERMIGVPHRIAVSYGAHKARPLAVALQHGLMNMVVTDVDTARAMLDADAGNERRSG
ncbi:sugar-binding domain-containing protein [Pseudonocardia nematodicida]|uniref:Sugar-binding domain-containing protein n=1 Tax=Pseudonocardia nematodicida TaxID=1206997 RepID=A0ABV1KFW5_9PSEU